MTAITLALAPIFGLIMIGYVIRWRGWLPDSFWQPAETLTYYVFFPALLVRSVAKAQLAELALAPMAATLLLALLAVATLAFALRRPLKLDGPAFSSMFQGAIRPNTYVGIAAGAGLYGDIGVTLIALCVAIVVPSVNVLSVIVLAAHGSGERVGLRATVIQIIKNPLIIACLSGAAINISGLAIPQVADNMLNILGQAALPLGLLAVGAGLNLSAAKSAGAAVVCASTLKLMVLPLLTFGAGLIFGLDPTTLAVCLIYAALPVSASSYVLARQMGGDGQLMASIITFSTIAAVPVLPLLALLVA